MVSPDAMQESEALLKVLVDRLSSVPEKGFSARAERARLRMLLRARLVVTRSALDDASRDLGADARDLFAWEVRLKLPLFCHIETVLGMVDEGALEVPVGWRSRAAAAPRRPMPRGRTR